VVENAVVDLGAQVGVGVLDDLFDHEAGVFAQTHFDDVLLQVEHEVVVLEVGVVLQQTLEHLVPEAVVHQLVQVAHQSLHEVVNHMQREVLDADVQHSAALDVLGQRHTVVVDNLEEPRVVTLDPYCMVGLTLVHMLQILQARLKSLFYEFLDDDAGVAVAHQFHDHF